MTGVSAERLLERAQDDHDYAKRKLLEQLHLLRQDLDVAEAYLTGKPGILNANWVRTVSEIDQLIVLLKQSEKQTAALAHLVEAAS
jgi:hypothetical protein